MAGETNLSVLLKNMEPVLNYGKYVFCSLTTGQLDMSKVLMLFKENEGTTIILEKKEADKLRLKYPSRFSQDVPSVYAWISLTVHSSLEAVGLTAAFATALGEANISCNVVAAYYHDHIFVPFEDAEKAMAALRNLAK